MQKLSRLLIVLLSISASLTAGAGELLWPLDCVPGDTCPSYIGYPDTDSNGTAFNCAAPGYTGHQGTDLSLTWDQLDQGLSVFAAAEGEVLWVFDGKYDRCPSSHPDCQAPPDGWFMAGESNGYRVCTDSGPYCGQGTGNCFWCFDGGNVVVIRHENTHGVFATRYDHLKNGSITVTPGSQVRKGQKIAEAASAGSSTGPHLHFEVWGTGFYELADPWAGPCGPNTGPSLWESSPPWDSVPTIFRDAFEEARIHGLPGESGPFHSPTDRFPPSIVARR